MSLFKDYEIEKLDVREQINVDYSQRIFKNSNFIAVDKVELKAEFRPTYYTEKEIFGIKHFFYMKNGIIKEHK